MNTQLSAEPGKKRLLSRPITLDLRPHHGMCMAYFQGKGYSPEFTVHMARTLQIIGRMDPNVRLVVHGDCICTACPFNHENVCETRENVDAYDRKVLEICGLTEGTVLPASVFRSLVREKILSAGRREEVCGNCSWTVLCHE